MTSKPHRTLQNTMLQSRTYIGVIESGNERNNTARLARTAPMIGAALPKATMITFDEANNLPSVRKVDFPDERSVAKYPHHFEHLLICDFLANF